jgi:iron complex transport system ATP-binding protein
MSFAEVSDVLIAKDLAIGYRIAHPGPLHLASGLNLRLQAGEIVGLLGPNGSGKSTLLRTLAGLQPSLEGTVNVLDHPIKSNSSGQNSRLLSIVLTGRIEVKNLSVYDLVAMGRYPFIDWTGRLRREDRDQIRQALERIRLWDVRTKYVNEMSDGEQQRVLLARALAQDTPLIILDEPTAHLDLTNRISMMHLLKNLARETQKAILFSSHDLDLALQVADHLWLLKKGGELVKGTPEQLRKGTVFEEVFIAGEAVPGADLVAAYFSRFRSEEGG